MASVRMSVPQVQNGKKETLMQTPPAKVIIFFPHNSSSYPPIKTTIPRLNSCSQIRAGVLNDSPPKNSNVHV